MHGRQVVGVRFNANAFTHLRLQTPQMQMLNLWCGSCMHPPCTLQPSHMCHANRCSSQARFVDAALPVLMQAFGSQVMSESTVPNQVCRSLSGLLFPAPPKVDTWSWSTCVRQTSDGTPPTAGRLCTSVFEPGPTELCSMGASYIGSESASSRAIDFSIT